MAHGITYYDTKGCCIYCGDKNSRRSKEHIVPYSLGGGHVLRDASCLKCADITKRFEQHVARDLWGDARTAYGAPTRHKRERKRIIIVPAPENETPPLKVPASEYPGAFVFYKMSPAGLLQGFSEDVDISRFWKMVVVDDDNRRERFIKKYPGKHRVRFRHVPESFGRLLAKIGYGQVMTMLDPGDFSPICLPYILGDQNNLSYVVGGTLENQIPQPENGYSISTVGFGSREKFMIIALVRLWANIHSPAYHVVVGDVSGRENVDRVLRKLDVTPVYPGMISNLATSVTDHWMPSKWPLPFWDDDKNSAPGLFN